MIPNVLLVSAVVVATTIAIVFALWSVRSYLEFKSEQTKSNVAKKRFAEIRAGALENSGRSMDPENFTAELLIDLLYEIQWMNLADVPKEWVAQAGELATEK